MPRFVLELLEGREVPNATLAYILPFHSDAYVRPMPDVPAEQILVVAADPDLADPVNPTKDVFVAHGGGDAVRMVVKDADTGRIERDFFVYDPMFFMGGAKAVTAVGRNVIVIPGNGAGGVFASVDILTGEIRHFAIPGVSPDWRGGGGDVTVVDLDHFGNGSTEPEPEVMFLVGPVVSYAEPTGEPRLNPVYCTPDPFDGVEREFVPATPGAIVPGVGDPGFSVQPEGAVPDESGHVRETYTLTFGGVFGPGDHPPESFEFYEFEPLGV